VIVFSNGICYSDHMEHRASRNLFDQRALRIRPALVMFLAFVYLFVGLAHATAHVNETITGFKVIPTTIALEASLATDGLDDGNSEKLSAGGEYCQVYAPILVPVLARVATPSAQLIGPRFREPTLLVEDHPRLDTPPPKNLI